MKFYKRYVETRDKKCIMPFKDKNPDELLSLDEAKKVPEYAGILGEMSVLVDFDDKEQGEIFKKIVEAMDLDCRIYQSTRGKHGVFKNSGVDKCGTKKLLACGLTADIKVGSSNSYEVLKFKGKERFIEWDFDENIDDHDFDGDYQELPKYFHPIKGVDPDFFKMEEGEGRNTKLFTYILTLQRNDFTVEEIKETIRIINQFVLKDPVSESELETILRKDSFKKQSFFQGTRFLHDHFGNHLIKTHNIKKINGQLHIYKDGIYKQGYEEIEKSMIKEISSITDAKRREAIKYIRIMSESMNLSEPNLIAFKNGVLNINSGELLPFDPSYVITNKINWDYNPEAYFELADKTLDKVSCGDESIRALIEEMIGSVFFRSNKLGGGKAFILTGSGSNGKSTILEVLKHILGDRNYSSLDLNKLNDRFSTVMLYNKLANIGDDLTDEPNVDTSIFKKIVTGNTIDAEQKGEPKFQFEPFNKLLFSANDVPKFGKGKDSIAVLRRLLIIPFEAEFKETDEDFDEFIDSKLKRQEAIEYFIKLGVEGLKRVIKNNYTKSNKVEKELEDFRIDNDPILLFVDEVGMDMIDEMPVADVYLRYSAYCAESNYKPLAKNEFSKLMQRNFNFETKRQGKGRVTTFVTCSN